MPNSTRVAGGFVDSTDKYTEREGERESESVKAARRDRVPVNTWSCHTIAERKNAIENLALERPAQARNNVLHSPAKRSSYFVLIPQQPPYNSRRCWQLSTHK